MREARPKNQIMIKKTAISLNNDNYYLQYHKVCLKTIIIHYSVAHLCRVGKCLVYILNVKNAICDIHIMKLNEFQAQINLHLIMNF